MQTAKHLRSEPFLWIHLSGIALLPVFLGIVWIALGMGNSFASLFELLPLVAIGIVPVLLMQLIRPFNIFSILLVSIKTESLSQEQREILSLFKTVKQQLFNLLAAGVMLLILLLLYRLSPLAVGVANFLPQWHILGLMIAIAAFLASNLFLQVPLSVLLVLLTSNSQLATVKPYPTEKIDQSFTSPGIKVNKILWFLESTPETTDSV